MLLVDDPVFRVANILVVAALLALLALPRSAAASEKPNVTVTLSPLHLLAPLNDNREVTRWPFVEPTGEFRLSSEASVAGILGWGREIHHPTRRELPVDVGEIGAQARWYAMGDFEKGLQLGVELLYLRALGRIASDSFRRENSRANGLNLGFFTGYKYVSDSHVTGDAQLGVSLAHTDTYPGPKPDDAPAVRASLLLNLNLGYSF